MKLLLIGATGTIGQAVATALAPRHDIVPATRNSGAVRVDITSPDSIRALFESAGPIDGVIVASGAERRKPLAELSDEDFDFSLRNKLMGQVNVVREAFRHVREGGTVVVTTGQASRSPSPGSAVITMVNAALEGFVRAAALDAPRKLRINAVSPPWATETLSRLGKDTAIGMPAAAIARAYVNAVEGTMTGEVIEPESRAGA